MAVRKAIPEGSGVPVIAGTGAPSARQAVRLLAGGQDAAQMPSWRCLPPAPRAAALLHRSGRSGGNSARVCLPLPGLSAPGIPLAALSELPVSG